MPWRSKHRPWPRPHVQEECISQRRVQNNLIFLGAVFSGFERSEEPRASEPHGTYCQPVSLEALLGWCSLFPISACSCRMNVLVNICGMNDWLYEWMQGSCPQRAPSKAREGSRWLTDHSSTGRGRATPTMDSLVTAGPSCASAPLLPTSAGGPLALFLPSQPLCFPSCQGVHTLDAHPSAAQFILHPWELRSSDLPDPGQIPELPHTFWIRVNEVGPSGLMGSWHDSGVQAGLVVQHQWPVHPPALDCPQLTLPVRIAPERLGWFSSHDLP